MKLLGTSLIGSTRGSESSDSFQVSNPATGETLDGTFFSATTDELAQATSLAAKAFPIYSQTTPDVRAKFLRLAADKIDAAGDAITARMMAEAALPEPRCIGERGRTVGQLRMFAELIEEGSWVDARIETAQPNRQPIPKPDLRSMLRARGPVAVFCASNFPLAFSVAGGDSASALAAGCPIVVRAHSAHAGTAEIVAQAIQSAVAESGLPEGTFSLIFDSGIELGAALVKDPSIKAVGFTGSRSGGRALMDLAASRDEPIPVYAEMSSVNPIFLLNGALEQRASEIGKGLAASVALGVGQFCTSPGLIFTTASDELESTLIAEFNQLSSATMLHEGIAKNYSEKLRTLQGQQGVEILAEIEAAPGSCCGDPALMKTTLQNFQENPALADEIFGPATILIVCPDEVSMREAAAGLEGQLTASVHGSDDNIDQAADLLQILETRAGRLIINGFPTGVEVCSSMVHGGPYPATSDGASTSVGTGAILRYSRAVSWQNFPESALPDELKSANPRGIQRLVNGDPQKGPLA